MNTTAPTFSNQDNLKFFRTLNSRVNNYFKENNLVNQIKQYLSTLLPKWMIPERFVFLEKIPLNANEKLDVKSLPELESTRHTAGLIPHQISKKLSSKTAA